MVGDFLFKRLHRNDSFSLKCMVSNHFVTFSSCCCVIMTEFARHNEKKIEEGTLWCMKCLQLPCAVIQRVPKDFFADNVSTRSHL